MAHVLQIAYIFYERSISACKAEKIPYKREYIDYVITNIIHPLYVQYFRMYTSRQFMPVINGTYTYTYTYSSVLLSPDDAWSRVQQLRHAKHGHAPPLFLYLIESPQLSLKCHSFWSFHLIQDTIHWIASFPLRFRGLGNTSLSQSE